MFITKTALPRRTFLRGIGATVALPLLDAMVPAATALAQTRRSARRAPASSTFRTAPTWPVTKRIRDVGTPVAKMVVDLIQFFGDTYLREFGFPAPPVHDPVAVAAVIRPEILETREVFVAVETRGEWTTGTTVVDFHGRYRRPANAKVGVALDVEAFWDLVIDALQRIG